MQMYQVPKDPQPGVVSHQSTDTFSILDGSSHEITKHRNVAHLLTTTILFFSILEQRCP